MAVVFEGELFADYHQFYLEDDAGTPDIPADWTDEAVRHRILCADGVVSVSTARNMTVPVLVELHDEPPQVPEEADHIVMANLRTAGRVVIAGCTDYLPDAARFSVPEGELRAMVVFTGLGTISEDGLEGGDRYIIHLWPGWGNGTIVLRQWEGD